DLGDTGRPPLELPGPDPRRRSRLPAPPAPSGDVSLWGLLRSSVGKDLSRVALPVQLNEPLNTLQRLCEELEYSELLDRASRARDPRQRLVYVAAFAVSAYASTYYRAGSKPFNPVLGETYECVRPDRGFRFISEQVGTGRGPGGLPELGRWALGGWKNKFWGKSLEIVPMGTVNVQLTGDHYEWNKVTTCIHNVLSGPRWIEHYGEVLIRNTRDASYHCKLTFCKVALFGELGSFSWLPMAGEQRGRRAPGRAPAPVGAVEPLRARPSRREPLRGGHGRSGRSEPVPCPARGELCMAAPVTAAAVPPSPGPESGPAAPRLASAGPAWHSPG
uniref:Oxysterol-binding protein n=1 Tax=Junco hyemalis TaxID=40217 RepID=A0A8C5NMJ4_JUNHY